jgi:nucleoid-associated protein YgaU
VSETRIYVVRAGDTLTKIAAFQLGSVVRWHDIAQANNLRDPHHLKVGQRLRIPEE